MTAMSGASLFSPKGHKSHRAQPLTPEVVAHGRAPEPRCPAIAFPSRAILRDRCRRRMQLCPGTSNQSSNRVSA
jgi:hypothetical protein